MTGGCAPNYYCPNNPVTRAQMAVFLLKSKYGAAHVPPAATGAVFTDVPAGSFAAAWIEELASLGVTSGCGNGVYCPNSSVTRKQMATFLLKTKLGSGHVPPSPAGVFADVPMADASAPWIEELYADAITGGCLTNPLRYCPTDPNTRGPDGGVPGQDLRPAVAPRNARPRRLRAGRGCTLGSKPMRALILEDDERLRSLVVRTLTRAGLACDEARSIDEAEELLGVHAYELLVLDRRLPDGDGLDVCRRARAKGFRHSILMLTAMDQRGGRDRGPFRRGRRLSRQALRPRGPRGPRAGPPAPQRGPRPPGADRGRAPPRSGPPSRVAGP